MIEGILPIYIKMIERSDSTNQQSTIINPEVNNKLKMGFEIKITPEMKAGFAAEMAEHLDVFEQMLLKLESGPFDPDAVNAAFRAVHSIKGNSDYVGVHDINELSNALEDLMDALRKQEVSFTDDTMPVLFECLDALRDINQRITSENYEEKDIEWLLKKIKRVKSDLPALSKGMTSTKLTIDVIAVFTKTSAQHIQYLSQQAENIIAGHSSKKVRENVLRILRTFFISANYAGFSSAAETLKTIEGKIIPSKTFDKRLAADLLEQLTVVETLIREANRINSDVESMQNLAKAVSADMIGRDMRLSPGLADELMSQSLELIIAVSGLNYAIDLITAGSSLSSEHAEEVNRAVSTVNRVSKRIHSAAQTIRLVRMDFLFSRLPRIVRDLSLKFGKEIEISIIGAETEIDRKIIEKLVDPMIHLIRNAVDHGIETPEERAQQGKPNCGTITVKTVQEGNMVVVDIIDDGRGIDPEEIKMVAMKGKTCELDTLKQMTSEELLNLIFTPGFTTADAKSIVSGRGVGLDIVNSNLRAVGGNVTLFSEKGKATRFRLLVPVSMSAVEVLLVEADEETYAVPLSCIVETLNIAPKDVHVVNNTETISYKEELIAVAHLRTMLEVSKHGKFRSNPLDLTYPMVVIAFGGSMKGIIVDRILRKESILVKPLERHFSGIDEFSGAALMGDGSIVLVLNPHGLV